MKVSKNWMKTYGGQGLNTSVENLVERIGSQLGAVEEIIKTEAKYDGILLVKIVEYIKHPDADKLNICFIDDARTTKNIIRRKDGLIQVVCGASNVRQGMLTAWIPPGHIVPSSFNKDPFVIETITIRGQQSNGMLASLSELALSEDHQGIVDISNYDVIDKKLIVGQQIKYLFDLDDYIIDIENKMFTHRPDLFGQIGVAREVSGIYRKKFESPDWYTVNNKINIVSSDTKLKIENKIPNLCRRYLAVILDNVEIKPSPIWLQSILSKVGIRPINNIVDITNYMMMATGQPLHAFDFDKVSINNKAHIIIRNPKEKESITLLDSKNIKLNGDDILICTQDKLLALGGVMGSNNSEIDNNTKTIIIECANFDMYNIRKTSMKYGIFTDAVTRFNKGQSTEQCLPVLIKTIEMTLKLSDKAKQTSQIVESYPTSNQNTPIKVSMSFINDRLGTELSLKEMTNLLVNVEFKILSVPADKKSLHVIAPFWRTDINIPEDIVEEVGRLYGYDNIILELPYRKITPVVTNKLIAFKTRLREALSNLGANEILTYSFTSKEIINISSQNIRDAFQLSNALSPELEYYRLSLTPSLLEKVHINIKANIFNENNQFGLFEINPVHDKRSYNLDGLPLEEQKLAFVFSADDKTAAKLYSGSAYYQARKYLDELMINIGANLSYNIADEESFNHLGIKNIATPYEKNRSAILKTDQGEIVGIVGEYNKNISTKLKLPAFSAGFEVDINFLMKSSNKVLKYVSVSKFPKISQDVTFKVPSKVLFGEFNSFILNCLNDNKPKNTDIILKLLQIYQPDGEQKIKNMSFRIWLNSYDKTLTTEEINHLLLVTSKLVELEFKAFRV